MRAVRVTGGDGPLAVEIGDVPDPVARPGEVLIEVEAAGVTFPDVLLTRDLYPYRPAKPFTLGGELAGVVRAAAEGSEYAAGDRVAAITRTGAFAELAAVPASSVFPLPRNVGFAAGACLPLNYLTMTFALAVRARLRPGETVLVHGAAGGIGSASIQLAKATGARVVSVVSTEEKAGFATALGSDEVVLTPAFVEDVLALTDGRGVDVVVDPVGGARFTDSLRCLAPLGRLLVIGFTAGEIPTVTVDRLLPANIDVRGVGWGAYAMPREGFARSGWDGLLPHLVSGALAPPVARVVPLEEAGEAVALLETRSMLGRVVVQP